MEFYKIIKSVINEEFQISPKQDVNTDKFFYKDNPKNIFENSVRSNEDYIINRKRKRDFYNNEKKDSQFNSEINCPKKHNLYPSLNIVMNNVCSTCGKKILCGNTKIDECGVCGGNGPKLFHNCENDCLYEIFFEIFFDHVIQKYECQDLYQFLNLEYYHLLCIDYIL